MGYQKDEHDTKFYRAVRKYGIENFYIEQIDTADNKNSKKCVSISVKDSNQVMVFNSIRELQHYHNVTTDTMVCFRCNGRTKSPYKGYYFKYYEDYIEGQQTIESIPKEKFLGNK